MAADAVVGANISSTSIWSASFIALGTLHSSPLLSLSACSGAGSAINVVSPVSSSSSSSTESSEPVCVDLKSDGVAVCARRGRDGVVTDKPHVSMDADVATVERVGQVG